MEQSGKRKSVIRRIGKILLWVAGIWAALLIILQIALSPSVLKKAAGWFAGEYIDGSLTFSEIRINMFRHFPNIGISMEDVALTYPADRFDKAEAAGAQGRLLYHGTGESADTLASFRHFSAGINVAALAAGKISVPYVGLVKPRIFAHSYDDGSANWEIFRMSAEEDTSKTALPNISIGRIRLREHPHIVYTDSKDTLFAMIDVKEIGFDGRLDTRRASRNKVGLTIDSVLVAGRLAADTIGLRVSRIHIHEHNDHMDIHADAKALLATRAFGRINIPMSISGTAALHRRDSVPSVAFHGFTAEIAAIPIEFDMDLGRKDGRFHIDGNFSIEGCKVEDMIDGFVKNIVPETAGIRTDAAIHLKGTCSGHIGNGAAPSFSVSLDIPDSKSSHKRLSHEISLALSAQAGTDSEGKINITVGKAGIGTCGFDLTASGSMSDALGDDPLFHVEGMLDIVADSLSTFLPEDSGIRAEGDMHAEIKGSVRMSQMDLYNFSKADVVGRVISEKFVLESPEDTIDIRINGVDIIIGPETRTSRKEPGKTFRLLAVNGSLSGMDVSLKESLSLRGEGMSFAAKNSVEAFSDDTTRIHPLGGHFNAKKIALEDGDGMSLSLENTANSFQMVPKTGHPDIPVLSINSVNKRIRMMEAANRAILTDASVMGKAAMNSIERRARMRARMDSIAALYPDIPRDSLLAHLRSQRKAEELPSWMTEEDFRSGDINFSLSGSLAKYFREWDMDGKVNVRTGIVMTPYLPIRNILKGMDISFSNNEVKIDSFKVAAGKSEIEAKGGLKGLRRALMGRGTYLLDLDVSSAKMDADELLAAVNAGSSYNPSVAKDEMMEASDAEFLKMVVADSLEKTGIESLIIVPANLMADIRLNASDVNFSDLDIESLHADIIMKERCMQIINASASTNMGTGDFEGFYATRTKKDIRTGFNLNLNDVTSEKVIAMMPAIDTIMPLLKSFKGMIDCELAATASLDTCMNILTPSINGVIRIGGENLTMSDNEAFSDIAKKLKFKNSKEGKINKMTVEGLIKDNTLEVFPFVLDLDRYTLALSGIHNMDMSFKYHASIIRSPILFKIGVDLYGPDFDNLKFKIGKPKYKTTDVPVFTTVIDDARINLAESIRNIFIKGVDVAVRENEMNDAIADHKEKIGYVNAAEQEIEDLSADERLQLEESRKKAEEAMPVDSLSIARTIKEYIIKDEQPGIY